MEGGALGYCWVTKSVNGCILGNGEFRGYFLERDIFEEAEYYVESSAWLQMFSSDGRVLGEMRDFANYSGS